MKQVPGTGGLDALVYNAGKRYTFTRQATALFCVK